MDIARSVASSSQSGFALSLVVVEKKEIVFLDASAEGDSQKVVSARCWQWEDRKFKDVDSQKVARNIVVTG